MISGEKIKRGHKREGLGERHKGRDGKKTEREGTKKGRG